MIQGVLCNAVFFLSYWCEDNTFGFNRLTGKQFMTVYICLQFFCLWQFVQFRGFIADMGLKCYSLYFTHFDPVLHFI